MTGVLSFLFVGESILSNDDMAVFLRVIGTEAMYADLGHFSATSIRVNPHFLEH